MLSLYNIEYFYISYGNTGSSMGVIFIFENTPKIPARSCKTQCHVVSVLKYHAFVEACNTRLWIVEYLMRFLIFAILYYMYCIIVFRRLCQNLWVWHSTHNIIPYMNTVWLAENCLHNFACMPWRSLFKTISGLRNTKIRLLQNEHISYHYYMI